MHLPIIDFGEGLASAADLRRYAATAADLGYTTLATNDHLVWHQPWLDGPSVLTSLVEQAGPMTLATSIAIPAVRHPVVLAKWLTTLGCLTDSRIVAGLGPGASEADYAAVGVPFAERWARFDEAAGAVKALVRGTAPPPGRFYDLSGVRLDPLPARPPEVWYGSWGSDRRAQAMARIADGWFASGYNTTPERFADARGRLDAHLRACGRDPSTFPDTVASMWLFVSHDGEEADRILRHLLAPTFRRDPDELAPLVPVGTPEHCAKLLTAYAEAGARQVLLWPVHDPVAQLHAFAEHVRPHVP